MTADDGPIEAAARQVLRAAADEQQHHPDIYPLTGLVPYDTIMGLIDTAERTVRAEMARRIRAQIEPSNTNYPAIDINAWAEGRTASEVVAMLRAAADAPTPPPLLSGTSRSD